MASRVEADPNLKLSAAGRNGGGRVAGPRRAEQPSGPSRATGRWCAALAVGDAVLGGMRTRARAPWRECVCRRAGRASPAATGSLLGEYLAPWLACQPRAHALIDAAERRRKQRGRGTDVQAPSGRVMQRNRVAPVHAARQGQEN